MTGMPEVQIWLVLLMGSVSYGSYVLANRFRSDHGNLFLTFYAIGLILRFSGVAVALMILRSNPAMGNSLIFGILLGVGLEVLDLARKSLWNKEEEEPV